MLTEIVEIENTFTVPLGGKRCREKKNKQKNICFSCPSLTTITTTTTTAYPATAFKKERNTPGVEERKFLGLA